MQRFFDVVLTIIVTIFLSPVIIPIILILKYTGEGEVFYIQERVGLNGKVFGLIKFATMLKNSSNLGAGDITIKNDPRVLPFGRFLRKSKINELPQLWNIFIGDMSIVGPRPMIPRTYEKYLTKTKQKLDTIRPGLTGIGSIIFRDEERYLENLEDPMDFYIRIIIPYKSELEIWFVEHNSLCLYIKIILVTAWIIFFPQSNIIKKAFKELPLLPQELI
jgi:lipopolysaccharide/colanic/teichoic acid biosynthesis glycosyltransferase